MAMQTLQDFQAVARENGFVETGETEGGSAVWFRNSMPDVGSQVHKRLCLDSLTKSATIFWETIPTKLNSITFRSASALRAWLELKIGLTT
jgi:cephalosporin hydroxylase